MRRQNPKVKKISVRLSEDVRNDMEIVAKKYGMSLSTQTSLAIKQFHRTLSE